MATATMTLTATLDGAADTTVSKSATLDDAVMPYFFSYYRTVYGQIDSGTVDDNGAPILRDLTDAETFAAYAAGISAGTVANVQGYVREQAAKQAMASVPTIEATPNP